MRHLALLFVLSAFVAGAQIPGFVYHSSRDQYIFPEEAPPAYVLRDNVALRAAPGATAGLIAQLAAGTRLQLDSMVQDTLEVDGVSSCWLKVTAGKRSGYLWGGSIAQLAFGSTADPTVKFVAGLDHYLRSDVGAFDVGYRIVALRDGREVDRIVVRSFAWGFEEVRNSGNLGLKNVDDVITLQVPCVGGCGCSTGEVVVFWSGGHLHHVKDLMGSPDGDFSTNNTFIYPADMEGEPGVIIHIISDYSEVEGEKEQVASEDGETGEYVDVITRHIRRQRLVWNGKALVPVGVAEEKQFPVLVH